MKLNDRANFFVFLENPLHEICLTQIKELGDEKRSTVGIQRGCSLSLNQSVFHGRNLILRIFVNIVCHITLVFKGEQIVLIVIYMLNCTHSYQIIFPIPSLFLRLYARAKLLHIIF